MKKLLSAWVIILMCIVSKGQPTQCFTVIHCDPSEPENFPYLDQLVDSANFYNIKLTIEFTGPWVDSIQPYPYRKNKIVIWHNQGHEIAMHHHDIIHPMNWDGYSNHTMAEIAAAGWDTNDYKGNMAYLYNRIQSIAGTNPIRTIGNADSVDFPPACYFQTQGILAADGFSSPTTHTYNNLTYCRVGYAFINTISVLNTVESLFPTMTAYNTLGIVTHVFNFKDNSFPLMEWFRYVNSQGLQAKTVAQCNIAYACPPLLSVASEAGEESVYIAPVPFKAGTHITFDKSYQAVRLDIYDIQGRHLEQLMYKQKKEIDYVNHRLTNGVYFFRFICDEGTPLIRRVLIAE